MVSRDREIIDFYLAHWGQPSELFLFFSPMMTISSLPRTEEEKYRFNIAFNIKGRLSFHSLSRRPMKPRFDEIDLAPDSYLAEMRWTIPFPLYTPFDAYLAYLDVVSETFIQEWVSSATRSRLSSQAKERLGQIAQDLSTIKAIMMMDYTAGFSRKSLSEFSSGDAMAQRVKAIDRIYRLITKKTIPALNVIYSSGILDPKTIILSQLKSSISRRLSKLMSGDPSTAEQLRRLAKDLRSIPRLRMGYQRRERVELEDLVYSIELAKTDCLRQLVMPVWVDLPESIKQELISTPAEDLSRVRTFGTVQLGGF